MCGILPASAETIRVFRAAMYECLLGYPDEDCTDTLWILYSGKLSREKFRKLVIFVEKTFVDCSLLLRQRTPCPKFHNFTEKTFATSHKSAKFAKGFSLESFPLYGI